MTLRLLARISAGFFVALFMTSVVFAVGVRPLRTELVIEPGTSAQSVIEVINEDDKTITVRPDIGIYTHNDEDGFPVRATLTNDDTRNISSWISFDEDEITLQPGEKRDVSFRVTVPRDAEPGGRYGSLIYTPTTEASDNEVAVTTRVASLLLITVAGEELVNGELTRFDLQQADIYGDQPFTFAVGLRNTGNIHIKPTGSITLLDEAGEQLMGVARYFDKVSNEEVVVDAIPVNILGGNILPDSTRVFRPEWTDNIAGGEYTANLSLYYGINASPITSSFDFSFAPELRVDAFDFLSDENGHSFVLTLNNAGDTYERPHGMIEIKNGFDYVVGELNIPDNLSYVAPGEHAEVVIPWEIEEIPDGRYIAHLTATYGPMDASLLATTRFGGSFLTSAFAFILLGGVVALGAAAWFFVRRKRPMFEAHISDNE